MTNLLNKAGPILQLLRDTRDCLTTTSKASQCWTLPPNQTATFFFRPIGMNLGRATDPRVSVLLFMQEITEWVLSIFRNGDGQCCGKKVKPFAGMQFIIDEVKPPMSEHWPCRFAYGLVYEGQGFVPCG